MDWRTFIDISKWQGTVNFATMRNSGVDALYMRAFQGVNRDVRVDEYAAGANSHGIPFGIYIYWRPGHDFNQQITQFVDTHRNLGASLIPMLDIEHHDDKPPEEIGRQVNAAVAKIEELLGVTPVIYTAAWFWNPRVRNTQVSRCPLWLARYTRDKPPVDPADWPEFAMARPEPAIPSGGWSSWDAWQFSADGNHAGRTYGASSSHLDLNILRGESWGKFVVSETDSESSMRPYTGFDFNATNKRAGLEALVDLLEQHFGVWNNGTYGIRNKRGKKSSSVHGTGRAADLSWRGAPYKGAGNYLEAVRLMDFLVQHADKLHIEAIFDYYPQPYGRGWRCDRGTWTNYSSRAFSGSPGGDWIHLEIAPSHCDDAAYYRRTFAGLLAPPDTFTPEPINLTGDFDMKLVNPPARLYDSRTGGGLFAAGETRPVRIMDTSAAFVNITVIAKQDGYLTAWADGAPQPNVSNVNFKAGDVVCNTNWVPVQNSHISIFCSGAADVIIDAQASA